MHLDLTERERQELVELVRAAVTDMSTEIHHTTEHQYRDELRERRVLLDGLLKRLEAVPQPA